MAGMNEEVDVLLDILRVGKEIYQEIQRNLFIVDEKTVERLRNRCLQFIIALLIASRNFESYQHIMGDIEQAVIEFQKLFNRLEERHCVFEEHEVNYSCPYVSSNQGRGRPSLLIPKEQLEGLRSLGFCWAAIAKILGVSEKTLRRRREEFNMSSSFEKFSDISNDEIDHLVKFALEGSPNSGERMLMGWFRGRGIRLQRWRLRESVMRVDPIGRELRRKTVSRRRVYSVQNPNFLWHIDGHHKLIRWRIVIHGAIDGYSRVVVFLKASTNNKATTVLELFLKATNVYHYPRRIRTDYGTENVAVAREMLTRYGTECKPVLTGRSVHNQRIERLWRDVHNYVVLYYKNIFYYLEQVQLLDPNDEIDLFALHFVYLSRINNTIEQFVMQWNNHPISREGGYSPLQKWTEGLYSVAHSENKSFRGILAPRTVDSHYGIDDDAPLPELQTNNHVEVPETSIQLSQCELQTLLNEVNPLHCDNEHGIVLYENTKRVLQNIISNR